MPAPVVAALRENMRRALRTARLGDAEDILARLKQEDPLSVETRGFELELHLNANRLAEAGTLADALCHLFPQSGRIFFLAGKVAYRLKDYAEAETRFRESHRIYPHWRTHHWLGRTLTQLGRFDEAESLLLSVREQAPEVLLDLGWLSERRQDYGGALGAYDAFLTVQPDHAFALERRRRIKARMLEPESLIEEVDALAALGENIPAALFEEYVQKLFETGQTIEARKEIHARLDQFDPKTGSRVAWICYRAKAYDLACALFIVHLRSNLSYRKYLNALESAATRCGRMPQVLDAYRAHAPEAPHLYGRAKSLARRVG